MNFDDIKLNSVNWEHGMLLTPEHFVRQERYLDSVVMWVLRYASCAYGLVGGGPRVPQSERGAIRYDPIVTIAVDGQSLEVVVTQCRGLTPAGCIVDVDADHPLSKRFPLSELEGVVERVIYVTCEPHRKKPTEGSTDEYNPQMLTERVTDYELRLGVGADKASYGLAVGRLRKQRVTSGYEKDPTFIPACTSMVSCSDLAAGWRNIVDLISALGDRYTELYRAMQEFLAVFKERGIEGDLDVEMMGFVGRLVVALQNCTHELLDPVQTPQDFFGKLKRFFHSAALFLDVSPAAQQYFEVLRDTGETEFISPLENQKRLLLAARNWKVGEDLAVEVSDAIQALDALTHLERALEGKYVDFRFSPSLEAMNFIFDRGGKELYKAAAKYARPQASADEWIFTFNQIRLEGRGSYRVVLVGQQGATFDQNTKIHLEIHLNVAAGYRRQPIILSCEPRSAEQCNFEFDFEAPPDVPVISDIQVHLAERYPIRSAILFVRQRFSGVRQVEPHKPLIPEARRKEDTSRRPVPPVVQERTIYARKQPPPDTNRPPDTSPASPRDRSSVTARKTPWDTQKRPDPRGSGTPPPRRKRLD